MATTMQHSAKSAPNFIVGPGLALQASIVLRGRKKKKQIKPLADAVIVSVKELGHDENGDNRKVREKMHNVISIQKHINDPRNENQKAHRINMGLIVCLHLCLLWRF